MKTRNIILIIITGIFFVLSLLAENTINIGRPSIYWIIGCCLLLANSIWMGIDYKNKIGKKE